MIETHPLDDPIDTDSADENFGSVMTPPGHQGAQSPYEPSSSSSIGLSSVHGHYFITKWNAPNLFNIFREKIILTQLSLPIGISRLAFEQT